VRQGREKRQKANDQENESKIGKSKEKLTETCPVDEKNGRERNEGHEKGMSPPRTGGETNEKGEKKKKSEKERDTVGRRLTAARAA